MPRTGEPAALRAEFDSIETHGSIPLLSASASQKDGQIAVSLSSRSKEQAQEVTLSLRGASVRGGILRTLAGAPDAHNSAEQPKAVGITEQAVDVSGSTLTLTLPPCSVQTLALTLA